MHRLTTVLSDIENHYDSIFFDRRFVLLCHQRTSAVPIPMVFYSCVTVLAVLVLHPFIAGCFWLWRSEQCWLPWFFCN